MKLPDVWIPERFDKKMLIMPYADFTMSASCLTKEDLYSQLTTSHSVLRSLRKPRKRYWHRVSLIWKGYAEALKQYHNVCLHQWHFTHGGSMRNWKVLPVKAGFAYPLWFGEEIFHSAHRAALLDKNPAWYSRYGWTETPHTEYWQI